MSKHTAGEQRWIKGERFVQRLEEMTDITVEDISKLPKRKPRRRTPRPMRAGLA